MLRGGKLGLLLLFAGGALVPLNAQKVVSARAGLITYLLGTVSLDGKELALKTARYPQMRDGQTLSTGRGRAELLLSPGVVLRLAEGSQLRMDDSELSNTRVTLQQGEALVEVVQLVEDNRVQVELDGTSTEFIRTGLYRIGISPNGTEQNVLRIYGGEALVRYGIKIADAKRGMAVHLNADLAISPFDRKQKDWFHDWAARRSFDLFRSDPDAREKQRHWQLTGTGYMENKNYGVAFNVYTRPTMPPSQIRSVPPAEHP